MSATTTVPPVALPPDLERELKQAGAQVGKWTAKRDELIRQAAEQGASLRAIGEAVGLSHTAVRFIAYGRPPR